MAVGRNKTRKMTGVGHAAPVVVLALALTTPSVALAEEDPPPPVNESSEAPTAWTVTPTAYVEFYYAYNTNAPRNGVTNYRGFDNRHNTFTLSNVVAGAEVERGPMLGKLLFQVGSTPSTVYLAEPARDGANGASATGPELWKYVQEARIGYRAPVGRGLLVEAGVFPSPCGIEVFAVKDNWNWSRSNLFFGLPFYHTGIRSTYAWSPEFSTALYVVNGWNSVVDNNEEKSVMPVIMYKKPELFSLQAMYLGGIERPTGSPEGPYWRHHFDVFGQVEATKKLSLAAQGDVGWEPNRFGTARWAALALYARYQIAPWALLAVRGDRFHEHLATEPRSSTPIAWGGREWVTSATATIDVRPHEHVSVRLEVRHDAAEGPLYFSSEGGRSTGGLGGLGRVPDADTQSTVLLGVTAWL